MKFMTQYKTKKSLALALTLALSGVPAFAQTAETGEPAKKQLSTQKLEDKHNPELIGKRDINKGQMNFYSLEKEVALGRQLAAEVDRTSKFVTDPAIVEYVNRVGQNLALHSDSKVPFTIKVIDSPDVNAFALPGGLLYVNRGVVEAAESEAELAGVMAHEIAHVAARHGVEQASKGQFLNYASIPLIFLGGLPGYILQQAAGLAVPLTFLKFSRGAEKEADLLASQYLWASGYDPNAMVSFFEKLQAKDKKRPGTIARAFSSHPPTQDRIKEVRKLLERLPERGEYQMSSSEFRQMKQHLAGLNGSKGSLSSDSGRPTLKRRPSSEQDATAAGGEREDRDRPTLKRREPGSDDVNTSESGVSGQSSGLPERPTLKRRPDAGNDQ
jgi:beta-barrel assembly-enhancing protease